ncbi:PEP-CTERM sorting domain-containing protein [Botrimarina hoheduenensis]|uniref:Uncharacterized protein n=1 Tax=Botrimarina hoheduenensis TaxID=2528000 RepID=A0A5C5VZF3_9BACT|nr:PEP-CTERM sorting domain-containing protein [Botrimarina hoheduenensis]TWT43169.1 hypothetical protein Pla111_21190 [Botrimarina hoheduenensis]
MKISLALRALCLVAVAQLPARASAEALWGADFLGAERLFPIDVGQEGRPQPVLIDLPAGPYPGIILDLASDPARQPHVLWAILGGSGADPSLLAINPLTRQTLSAIGLEVALSSLAIDPLTGQMYGAKAAVLYFVDPLVGTLSVIGTTPNWVDEALVFDADGLMYGIGTDNGRLVRVDKQTAQTSVVGTQRIAVGDLAVRPSDGAMFGIDIRGRLFQVNPEDGSGTTIVQRSMTRATGLAFLVVPEPTALALAATALAAMSVRTSRRA